MTRTNCDGCSIPKPNASLRNTPARRASSYSTTRSADVIGVRRILQPDCRASLRRVHSDYTEWSAPQPIRDLMGEEADALLAHRYEFINVWWPIRIAA